MEFHHFHLDMFMHMLEILFICLLAISISCSSIVYHSNFAYFTANLSIFFLLPCKKSCILGHLPFFISEEYSSVSHLSLPLIYGIFLCVKELQLRKGEEGVISLAEALVFQKGPYNRLSITKSKETMEIISWMLPLGKCA